MLPTTDDTIAAIATAPGAAGLAVVRVSGADATAVADAVFRGAAPLAAAAANTLHHGWAVDAAGGRVDEVVAAVFRAPRSYTREDVVELSCHGGALASSRVLAALLAAGARLARPGEFTLRAFLKGRLDLAQAEAVADVIAAGTRAAHDLALAQLAGALSRRLDALSERLADALAEVEAGVDFAEDVGGVEVPAHVAESIAAAESDLTALLAHDAWARALREGVRVPIVGRPNVGKSSLFNALLGEARAIVSAVPGTTRDRVSEAIEVAGVRVTLSDTAGLRATREPIEALGVARAEQALADSTLVLWVVDGAAPLEDADRAVAERIADRPVLVALNQADRGAVTGEADVIALLDGAPRRVVRVSALRGDGLEAVREALAGLLGAGGAGEAAAGDAVANARHAEALGRARAALARAGATAADGAPGEIVAIELHDARRAVGEVTGRSVDADLLDRIFSRFCVGK
jgi:tRNA modification GTPase